MSPAKLDGRIALVTGASRGIGAAIALAFAREGATVVVNYHRSEARARAVAGAIHEAGGRALVIGADVADAVAVRAMVADALAAFGRIDVLVNNAGILQPAPIEGMSDELWDTTIATNLRSVFLVTRAVIPGMLARGRGAIVNIASQLGQKGMPNHTHYAAAKAGIIGFTKALAREVGPRGIRVNAISPGAIETDLIGPVTPEWKREKSAPLALGRIGVPDDVAPTAVFLASDDAAFYAGQTFSPNGGDMMP